MAIDMQTPPDIDANAIAEFTNGIPAIVVKCAGNRQSIAGRVLAEIPQLTFRNEGVQVALNRNEIVKDLNDSYEEVLEKHEAAIGLWLDKVDRNSPTYKKLLKAFQAYGKDTNSDIDLEENNLTTLVKELYMEYFDIVSSDTNTSKESGINELWSVMGEEIVPIFKSHLK